jgi:hypothetical protein
MGWQNAATSSMPLARSAVSISRTDYSPFDLDRVRSRSRRRWAGTSAVLTMRRITSLAVRLSPSAGFFLAWTSRVVALLVVGGNVDSIGAQTIEYLLRPTSLIRPLCDPCPGNPGAAEELHGTFDLTVLAIPDAYAIEAVTGVSWHSSSYDITGAGFLERLGPNRISMVVDAVINGEPVLLTSASHPTVSGSGFRISLTSAPQARVAAEIEVVAFANATDSPDSDGDGIPDVLDRCPFHHETRQQDEDLDGVGNACDACPGTTLGVPVLSNGCSIEQICPCSGPEPGQLWEDQRAYVSCVARVLKALAGAEQITREQARNLAQAAVRSGCGMPVVASARR